MTKKDAKEIAAHNGVRQVCTYVCLAILLLFGHSFAYGQSKTLTEHIDEMKKELEQTLTAHRYLPRETANYAESKKVKAKPAVVVRELIHTHANEPLVDAYVKWQLLSFMRDDFDWATLDKLDQKLILDELPPIYASNAFPQAKYKPYAQRLIKHWDPALAKHLADQDEAYRASKRNRREPAFFSHGQSRAIVIDVLPVISETQIAFKPIIVHLNTGFYVDSLGRSSQVNLLALNELEIAPGLKLMLPTINAVGSMGNDVSLAYRDLLYERLPRGSYFRLRLLLKDIRDRMHAQRGFEDALVKLQVESAAQLEEVTLVQRERIAAIAAIKQIQREHKKQAAEFKGEVAYGEGTISYAELHQKMLERAISFLNMATRTKKDDS